MSTYSNLDNHPSVIGSDMFSIRNVKRKKPKKRIAAIVEEVPGNEHDSEDDEEDEEAVNAGEARRKTETALEKKSARRR